MDGQDLHRRIAPESGKRLTRQGLEALRRAQQPAGTSAKDWLASGREDLPRGPHGERVDHPIPGRRI